MSATNIRVNPASIVEYGGKAQAAFDTIHTSLKSLTDTVTEVHYFGPNAVTFKTELGAMAETLATTVSNNMGIMADAINTSTSNISQALGGEPVRITINPTPIVAPPVAAVDFVDVDTSALDTLKSTVTAKFDEICTQLDGNAANLHATDWLGTAKENATGEVDDCTGRSTGACSDTAQQINDTIQAQIDSVLAADR